MTPVSKSSIVSHFSSRWVSNSTSSPVVAAQYRPGVCALFRYAGMLRAIRPFSNGDHRTGWSCGAIAGKGPGRGRCGSHHGLGPSRWRSRMNFSWRSPPPRSGWRMDVASMSWADSLNWPVW